MASKDALLVATLAAHLVEIRDQTCDGCRDGDPLDHETMMHTSDHPAAGKMTWDCSASHLYKLLDAACDLSKRLDDRVGDQ